MPIKFGSTLTSKLAKKYWERTERGEQAAAVRHPGLLRTRVHGVGRTSLMAYLYGREYEWEHDARVAGLWAGWKASRRASAAGWGSGDGPRGGTSMTSSQLNGGRIFGALALAIVSCSSPAAHQAGARPITNRATAGPRRPVPRPTQATPRTGVARAPSC